MAAVSGAVRVRLEKVEYHVLGDGFDAAEAGHIKKAVGVVGIAAVLVVGGIWLVGRAGLVGFYN